MKKILWILAAGLLSSCNDHPERQKQDSRPSSLQPVDTAAVLQPGAALPFTGKRSFETRAGVSGTGTPHWYVEILPGGDVFFSFEQENQADGDVISERYFAGKYQPVLKCIFSKLDGEVRYYRISGEKIRELDAAGHALTSADCCTSSNDTLGSECPCEGALFTTDETN